MEIRLFGGGAPPGAEMNVREASQHRELVRAIGQVNGARVLGQDNELQFSVDSASRRPVILLVNRDTREVVGQIPPEYITKLASDIAAGDG
jgi:uncharacterized FlaG/YvyC family protein